MDLKNAENWNQTQEDWLFILRSNPNYCLVAILDNVVVGTVTAFNYQNKIAWIGMMLVAKEYRGNGISKLLLATIIEKLNNCDSIKLDATSAGLPLYKKLGFIEEYEIKRLIFRKALDIECVLNNFDSINLSRIIENNLKQIGDFDETIFGSNRLKLFEFLFWNESRAGFQVKQGDDLIGFVFGRNGSNYFQVGPLMAHSTQVAKNLLTAVFSKLKKESLLVDIILLKDGLEDWLLSIGFEQQRSFTRMYLGSNKHCSHAQIEHQFLISGPEFG